MAGPSGPKLDDEQRETLLTWLAAGYSTTLIGQWFKEREWPELSRAALTYYRKKYQIQIAELQAHRHSVALTTGLALKEERVARLKEHADALDAIKWLPGQNGRLYNEKAWRETLDDIAKETGGRVQRAELTGLNGAPLLPPITEVEVRLKPDEPLAD